MLLCNPRKGIRSAFFPSRVLHIDYSLEIPKSKRELCIPKFVISLTLLLMPYTHTLNRYCVTPHIEASDTHKR